MPAKATKRSVALKRKLSGYPPDKYLILFKAYFHNRESDSGGITVVLKKFFDDLPPADIKYLQEYYKKHIEVIKP